MDATNAKSESTVKKRPNLDPRFPFPEVEWSRRTVPTELPSWLLVSSSSFESRWAPLSGIGRSAHCLI